MIQNYDSQNKTLRLIIPGDVLSTNVDTLRQEIVASITVEQPTQRWNVLELDLRAARMIDSAGLNLIVAIVRMIDQRAQKLRALVDNTNIQRTFLFTRLDKHLELVCLAKV